MAKKQLALWQEFCYGSDEAARAAFDYYRERGWPVDDDTFPNRDRCEAKLLPFIAGFREALRRMGAA